MRSVPIFLKLLPLALAQTRQAVELSSQSPFPLLRVIAKNSKLLTKSSTAELSAGWPGKVLGPENIVGERESKQQRGTVCADLPLITPGEKSPHLLVFNLRRRQQAGCMAGPQVGSQPAGWAAGGAMRGGLLDGFKGLSSWLGEVLICKRRKES